MEILIFVSQNVKAYKRRIWRYNDGNYELLRRKVSTSDWSICHNSDINVYAQNIVKSLNALTETCVPIKIVTFRTWDPPWLTTAIKKHIRKRKRAYRKAKRTNLQTHWVKFKYLRNLVTTMIRESKKAGRPKAALLFWFFGDFRCGALLFMVIHVIYKYKKR